MAQYVALDPSLLEHSAPARLPPPACTADGKPVSCVAQVIEWIEDEWCPVVRAHNCDKALIRCTQPTPDGKRPAADDVMRCITRAGGNECSASCGLE